MKSSLFTSKLRYVLPPILFCWGLGVKNFTLNRLCRSSNGLKVSGNYTKPFGVLKLSTGRHSIDIIAKDIIYKVHKNLGRNIPSKLEYLDFLGFVIWRRWIMRTFCQSFHFITFSSFHWN